MSTSETVAQDATTIEKEKVSKEDNLRRQREYYERLLSEAQEKGQELEKKLAESHKPILSDIDDDEPYIDSKSLNRRLSAFQKQLEGTFEQKAEEKARSLINEDKKEIYLKSNPDFNKVMNGDLLQKFAEQHPRVAENLLQMPDNFERQKLVYETIKSLKIDEPQQKTSDIQGRINANQAHPGYAPSDTATAPYQGYVTGGKNYSPSEQKNAYEKMQELKSRLRI